MKSRALLITIISLVAILVIIVGTILYVVWKRKYGKTNSSEDLAIISENKVNI